MRHASAPCVIAVHLSCMSPPNWSCNVRASQVSAACVSGALVHSSWATLVHSSCHVSVTSSFVMYSCVIFSALVVRLGAPLPASLTVSVPLSFVIFAFVVCERHVPVFDMFQRRLCFYVALCLYLCQCLCRTVSVRVCVCVCVCVLQGTGAAARSELSPTASGPGLSLSLSLSLSLCMHTYMHASMYSLCVGRHPRVYVLILQTLCVCNL